MAGVAGGCCGCVVGGTRSGMVSRAVGSTLGTSTGESGTLGTGEIDAVSGTVGVSFGVVVASGVALVS